jgi:hypothetical protein
VCRRPYLYSFTPTALYYHHHWFFWRGQQRETFFCRRNSQTVSIQENPRLFPQRFWLAITTSHRTCNLSITSRRCTVWRKGPLSALAAGQVRPFLVARYMRFYRYVVMIPLICRHDDTILAGKQCPTTIRACFCARWDDERIWTGTQRPQRPQ